MTVSYLIPARQSASANVFFPNMGVGQGHISEPFRLEQDRTTHFRGCTGAARKSWGFRTLNMLPTSPGEDHTRAGGTVKLPKQRKRGRRGVALPCGLFVFLVTGTGYFFFLPLACAKLEAIGALSALGVFGFCRSFPAWEATFFEVGMSVNTPFQAVCCRGAHENATGWVCQYVSVY